MQQIFVTRYKIIQKKYEPMLHSEEPNPTYGLARYRATFAVSAIPTQTRVGLSNSPVVGRTLFVASTEATVDANSNRPGSSAASSR